jgi:hypothetical protein
MMDQDAKKTSEDVKKTNENARRRRREADAKRREMMDPDKWQKRLEANAKRQQTYRAMQKQARETAGENDGTKEKHCAPYNKQYNAQEQLGNSACMSLGAGDFYELLGGCQYDGGLGKCPGKKMLMCKCTPWTRFPTEKGMFCATFKTWVNPKPLRNPQQMKTDMRLSIFGGGRGQRETGT